MKMGNFISSFTRPRSRFLNSFHSVARMMASQPSAVCASRQGIERDSENMKTRDAKAADALVGRLKRELSIPVGVHTHFTSGMAYMTLLRDYPALPGATLKIDTYRGSVDVRESPDNRIPPHLPGPNSRFCIDWQNWEAY